MFIRKLSTMKTRIAHCPAAILDFCPEESESGNIEFYVYNCHSKEGASFTSLEVHNIWGM
jgi:hypothetical protein